MKQKKWLIPILVLVLLLQVLAPVGLIAYHNKVNRDLEQKGEIYRIPVSINSINYGDVYYRIKDFHFKYPEKLPAYFVLYTDVDGITYFNDLTYKKPSDDMPYIRFADTDLFPYSCMCQIEDTDLEYMRRYFYYDEDDNDLVSKQNWYLELTVYKGHYTIHGIVDEDGMPCEQLLNALL